MPLWPQSASPTRAKGAEEHDYSRRCTQGGARFQRACPGLVCFALSALLPLRGNKMPDRPSSARRAVPCISPGEAPGGRRNPGCDSNLELRPEGATLARHVQTHRTGERHIVHPTSITPMKPAAAKVGGNQGRMVGRRRAVGFLQIVPGVFPTGVVTDRLRKKLLICEIL